ncbi:unnamed protein product [Clavelina lepadiformis]|uniref:Ubiquitin-like protease family profile domain-containing protein n=1 Tax=Clavelina lepadiformis TaxID=159417 RepID=A0ABP0FEJ6_CLALP
MLDLELLEIKHYASTVWRTPFVIGLLCNMALETKSTKKVLWLDILSCSTCLQNTIVTAMKEHVQSPFQIGWLTKFLVDSYVSSTMQSCYEKTGKLIFGAVDCDMTTQVLHGFLPKSWKTSTPAHGITEGNKKLRKILFFPLLWNNHFLLLCYDQIKNHLTLYNSVPEQCRSLVSKIESKVIDFLGQFDNVDKKKIIFAKERVMTQRDSSSCGVCVCITVDAICSKNLLNAAKADINDFRCWIIYSLFVEALNSDVRLFLAAKSSILELKFGLPNVGNSCWFNCMVHAIIFLIDNQYITKSLLSECPQEWQNALMLFRDLQFRQKINEHLLQTVLTEVCISCNFVMFQQQDALEFYEMWHLSGILTKFGYSTEMLFRWEFLCQLCGAHNSFCDGNKRSLLLPLYNKVRNGSMLSLYIAEHFTCLTSKGCSSCPGNPMMSINIQGRSISMSELLVIGLGRRDSKSLSEKIVVPNRELTIPSTKGKLLYKLANIPKHDKDVYKNTAFMKENKSQHCKKIIKLRKRPKCIPDMEIITTNELEEFQPQYNLEGEDGKHWKDLLMAVLDNIAHPLIDLIQFSVENAKSNMFAYRHYLFLQCSMTKLKLYDSKVKYTEEDLNSNLVLNLMEFVRSRLCVQQVRKRWIDNSVISRITVGNLYIKEIILDKRKELAQYFERYQCSCNDYLVWVLDVEAVIYLTMHLYHLDHNSASKKLNFPIITSVDEI